MKVPLSWAPSQLLCISDAVVKDCLLHPLSAVAIIVVNTLTLVLCAQ